MLIWNVLYEQRKYFTIYCKLVVNIQETEEIQRTTATKTYRFISLYSIFENQKYNIHIRIHWHPSRFPVYKFLNNLSNIVVKYMKWIPFKSFNTTCFCLLIHHLGHSTHRKSTFSHAKSDYHCQITVNSKCFGSSIYFFL